jgi:hypothetical protein
MELFGKLTGAMTSKAAPKRRKKKSEDA